MNNNDNTFRRVDWAGDQPQPSDDDDEHGLPVQLRGPGLSADDLELLKLAARALGATVETVEGEQWVNLHFADGRIVYSWNPLLHSDDFLDLQATLNLHVHPYFGGASDYVSVGLENPNQLDPAETKWLLDETGSGNPAALIRRAVTRAAAEIGKAMP